MLKPTGWEYSTVESQSFNLSTKNEVMEEEGAFTEVVKQGSAGEMQVAAQSRRS